MSDLRAGAPSRVAVVDLGCNALRLAVFELEPDGALSTVAWDRMRVRLGEGMEGAAGVLQPAPMQRTIRALTRIARRCREDRLQPVAVATSAVRDAVNRDAFVERVASVTGLRLRVLTVEEEACYACRAATETLPLADALVVEIGGGSVQVGRMAGGRLKEAASAPLGAVRAMERWPLGDPPAADAMARLRAGLAQETKVLSAVLAGACGPASWAVPFVGVSGTVKSLGRMHRHAAGLPAEPLHGHRVPRPMVVATLARLAGMTLEHRRSVVGLEPDRADVILAGLVLLDVLMAGAGASEVVVCRSGIREALALEALRAAGSPPGCACPV